MILLPAEFVPYKVVEVRQSAAFAGRLGQRASEEIVIERGGARILVRVAESYHTRAVREGSRLHVGDTVTIRGEVGETVARERIRRVRP